MSLVKTVELRILADAADAQAKLDEIDGKAKNLDGNAIKMRFRVDSAEGKAQLDELRAKADKLGYKDVSIRVRVDGAGRAIAELDAVKREEDKVRDRSVMNRLGGLFAGAGGGIPGQVGLPMLGQVPLPLLAALVPAIGAVLVEGLGLLSGGAAAAAGGGAFYAFARPSLSKLQSNYAGILGARNDYQNASQNLVTAIGQSPADLKNYQATLQKVEPDLRNAARLLTDQNVQWEKLSPAMQRSVIALANNKQELKALLPDQRAALSALLKQQDAWGNLSDAQQKVIPAIDQVRGTYNKLSSALEPVVLKVVGSGLKLANTLLPALKPFAETFGNVFSKLLGQADRFAQSKGFQDWLKQFHSLEGPALGAIGHGIGQVVNSFGKLLTLMSGKDVAHAINIAFGAVSGAIEVVTFGIRRFMQNWDSMSKTVSRDVHEVAASFDSIRHGVASAFDSIRHGVAGIGHDIAHAFDGLRHFNAAAFSGMISFFAGLPGRIKGFFAGAGGWLVSAGSAALHGLESGAKAGWGAVSGFVSGLGGRIMGFFAGAGGWLVGAGRAVLTGFLNGLQSAWGAVTSFVSGIAGWIASHKGPLEADRVLLVPHGQAIMGGLMGGMNSQMPALRSQLAGVSATIGSGVGARGYGGGGGDVYNLHFHGVTTDQGTVRQLVQVLREYKRHGGGQALGIA